VLLHFLVASLTTLTLFMSMGGVGHGLNNDQSGHHKAASDCQTACPSLLSDKQKNAQLQENDANPDPLPLQISPAALHLSAVYGVLFSALAWLFLQRRPPDLLALNVAFRN
jgi:hypothetical protein